MRLNLRKSFAFRFLHGAGSLLRAVGMIATSGRLLLLSALPFALCMLIYVAFFGSAIVFADELAGLAVQPGPWWRDIVHWTLLIMIPVAALVLSVFTFALACFVVAAPLYDLLSAAAEKRLTGTVREEPVSLKAVLEDLWRALTDSVRILLIELGVLLLGLVFVPVTAALATMASGVLLALECCDYPMGRRRLRFGRKLQFARRHVWEMLGLGLPLLFLLGIPFVGVAFLPVAVVAATVLYVELAQEAGEER